MALTSGTKLGPYEILAPLGAGGMGEVYRATDTRLGRDVALKILPESFAREADRLRRFEQEARAVAALNHPNILAVFDIGQHEGSPFLVSELLEGDTLRAALDGGALPQRKTIEYGVQIAHGLAAAHEKGIVHRDFGFRLGEAGAVGGVRFAGNHSYHSEHRGGRGHGHCKLHGAGAGTR